MRCPCQTKSYRRCKNKVSKYSDYCHVHSEKWYKKRKNYCEDEFECPVCYSVENEFNETCVLPCGHKFCALCVKSWFKTNKNTCPLCRCVVPFKFIAKYDPDFDKRGVFESFDMNINIPSGTIMQQRHDLNHLIGVLQSHLDSMTADE